MTDTNTLAPCPFCGERAETDFIPEHHSYQIACSDSIGCTARITRDSELGAIEAWNCRAALAAPAQAEAPAQAGEYPELPPLQVRYDGLGHTTTMGYGASQMRDYADATCAARGAAQDAPVDAAAQQDAERRERERICAAIKAEDDYCVEHGDYMLDSDDCIKIVRGEWKRPEFAAHGIAAQQGDAA